MISICVDSPGIRFFLFFIENQVLCCVEVEVGLFRKRSHWVFGGEIQLGSANWVRNWVMNKSLSLGRTFASKDKAVFCM